jgi:hypothetical protein
MLKTALAKQGSQQQHQQSREASNGTSRAGMPARAPEKQRSQHQHQQSREASNSTIKTENQQ